jgi:hypothetical protein
MTTALLETVTVPAPDAEPPKRKRGRTPKVVAVPPLWEPDDAKRAELVRDCALAISEGWDVADYVFGGHFAIPETTKASILVDGRLLAEQRAADAEAAEAAKPARTCAGCHAVLIGERADYRFCEPCDAADNERRTAASARVIESEASERQEKLVAERKAIALAPKRLAENDGNGRAAVLALMLDDGIPSWEAETAVAQAVKLATAAKASRIDGKARRSRATLELSHRVREWCDSRAELDAFDVAIVEAQLRNVNGTTRLAYCAAETIATRAHIDPTTVRRRLRKLADLGLFSVETGRGNRRPTRCTFLV